MSGCKENFNKLIIFTLYTKAYLSSRVQMSYGCMCPVGACVLWVHVFYGCVRPMGACVLWVCVSYVSVRPLGVCVL